MLSSVLFTDLPPDPTSAGAARRFVTTALHRLGREELSELAELLVSELVTNAVLHARTAITLEVARGDAGGVRVGVGDASSRGPRRRGYSPQATTGRGLALVDALASSWGTAPTSAGKMVWFELTGEGAMAT